MFLAHVICTGIPEAVGADAAARVVAEFANHGSWSQNVSCEWDGLQLTVTAESESDNSHSDVTHQLLACLGALVCGAPLTVQYDITET